MALLFKYVLCLEREHFHNNENAIKNTELKLKIMTRPLALRV